MQTVILIIHLIIVLFLIGVVLLQRSEGGALGIGGGGGGVVSGRGATTALQKATWGLSAAFLTTSLILTVISARDANQGSVLDAIPSTIEQSAPAPAPLDALLPPSLVDEPATPPAE